MRRFCLLLFISFFAILHAENDTLTLAEYKNLVLNYSQILKTQVLRTQIATYNQSSANTGYLPKIDFSARGTLDLSNLDSWSGPIGTYRNYGYLGEVSLSQPILSGGSITGNQQATKSEKSIAFQNEEVSYDNICYQAEVAFWNTVAYSEILASAKRYVSIIESLYQVIEDRFEAGMIGKNDQLLIVTRLKEAMLQLSVAEKYYKISMQKMNILMGMSAERPIHLRTSLFGDVIPNDTFSIDQVIGMRPDYRISVLNIERQKAYNKIALSKYNPQMGLTVGAGYGTATPNIGKDPAVQGLAALSLKIPVFYWGERDNQVKVNRAMTKISQLALEQTIDNIRLEYETSLTNLKQSRQEIILSIENANTAQESLDLITYSYTEGGTSITEVLSSQLSWLQSNTSLINAYLGYRLSWADYKRVISENRAY